jgi:hypothetical protein
MVHSLIGIVYRGVHLTVEGRFYPIKTLLNVVPHVKYWWETYYEKNSIEESGIFGFEPTWDSFMDDVKEQY